MDWQSIPYSASRRKVHVILLTYNEGIQCSLINSIQANISTRRSCKELLVLLTAGVHRREMDIVAVFVRTDELSAHHGLAILSDGAGERCADLAAFDFAAAF